MAPPKKTPPVDLPADVADAPLAAQLEAVPDPLVRARFVDVQSVLSGGRIVRYGDEISVTLEQLAADDRFVAWDDEWTPDPAALAASTLEG